jgi:16S rRNA (guanine527-N7)-methyltransferase
VDDGLPAVLERARGLGFLGPGEPSTHLEHARAFVLAWGRLEPAPPERACDLGAGGGVPGLALAAAWPTTPIVLLDGSARRCAFLRDAVELLGWTGRVSVAEGRAEDLARGELEATQPLVVARSFGPPAVTAECAVRLLVPNGLLLVAEPPDADLAARWPAAPLAAIGLGPAVHAWPGPRLAGLRRVGDVPSRIPRRVGVPAKRPLF